MSEWTLIDADLGRYHSTKFKSGGRLYFIKAGRKNVSIYDLALRKNVSIKMSAIPQFFLEKGYELQQKIFDKYPKTYKSILNTFRVYKQKTKQEKDILDTLKTKIKLTK